MLGELVESNTKVEDSTVYARYEPLSMYLHCSCRFSATSPSLSDISLKIILTAIEHMPLNGLVEDERQRGTRDGM